MLEFKKKTKLERFIVLNNAKGYLALSCGYYYWTIQFTSCCLLFSVSNELKMQTFPRLCCNSGALDTLGGASSIFRRWFYMLTRFCTVVFYKYYFISFN